MGRSGRGLQLGVLALCAAGLGLLWGRAGLPPTETEVIEAMAARYVAETGGAATDCVARPGPGEAWITVYCGRDAARHVYPVDRDGRLISLPEAGT
ncbi:MAG: hypothetical protein AAF914_06080 [Pseudomonadota bacterium]